MEEALDRLLRSYEAYYNVNRETPVPPFAAEAVFHSHEEGFFLVKSAKLTEAESFEYVFFALEPALTLDRLKDLAEKAWNAGISRVQPHSSHQSSDVVLAVLADQIEPEAFEACRKLKYYKSYCFSLQGWSHFRLYAVEVSSGRTVCNRQGRRLKSIFQSIVPAQQK